MPRDSDTALRAALLSVLERDLDRAETLLSHAARLDSNAVEPYLALARLYRMRGEIGRAIQIHQNLLLRPGLSQEHAIAALTDLAADFRQGGFLQRAIASYEEVLLREPSNRRTLEALVPLLASVRNFPRAIEISRRLGKLGKASAAHNVADLLVQMAEACQAEGDSVEARRAVKRALRKDPECVRGWVVLGDLEAERGKHKAALSAWSRVPEIDRRSGPLVFPKLEPTYAALNRPRDFEMYLRGLLDGQPHDADARIALAHTLAARGDVDVAIDELRHVEAHDPDNLEARAVLGRLLLAERRDAAAVRAHGELIDVLERRGLLREREKLT